MGQDRHDVLLVTHRSGSSFPVDQDRGDVAAAADDIIDVIDATFRAGASLEIRETPEY